jgi:hypothetical protein
MKLPSARCPECRRPVRPRWLCANCWQNPRCHRCYEAEGLCLVCRREVAADGGDCMALLRRQAPPPDFRKTRRRRR